MDDTFRITIAAVNDDPSANDENYNVNENSSMSVPAPGVLANDTDIDSVSLTAVLAGDPSHGSVTLNTDGSFIYTPDANFNGSDSFTYEANDGAASSNTATVTIAVSAMNNPPVANNDGGYSVDENASVTVSSPGVLANDTDIDSASITAVLVGGPSHGAVQLNADGSFTYIPATNYHGNDGFTYFANDGALNSAAPATVTITVNPLPGSPVIMQGNAVIVAMDEDGIPTAFALTLDATDADGDPLSWSIGTQPVHGTATVDPSGNSVSVGYFPTADYNGSDSFVVEVSDGALTDIIAVNVTIHAVNDAPVLDNSIVPVLNAVPENPTDADNPGTQIAEMLTGPGAIDDPITDPDAGAGEGIAIISADTANGVWMHDHDGDGGFTTFPIDIAEDGALLLRDDAVIRFVPFADFNGTALISFRAWDRTTGGNGDEGMDTSINGGNTAFSRSVVFAEVVVTADNIPLFLTPDAYTSNEDDILIVPAASGVLSNDTGESITALVETPPANGSLDLSGNGGFTYRPDADFFGIDVFIYTVTDVSGLAGTAAPVVIDVLRVDDPPRAVADAYRTDEDTPLFSPASEGVLQNDAEVDGQALSATFVTGPVHGVLVLNSDGSFTYIPDSDYHGRDGFTYTAGDGSLESDEQAVTITVRPTNDPPVVDVRIGITIPEDTPFIISPSDLVIEDVDGGPAGAYISRVDDGENYTVSGISTDEFRTLCSALEDINGDGVLDLVIGTNGVNRLFINNGTSDPFTNARIVDITGDDYMTVGLALGDFDKDGDMDAVTGNYGAPDYFYPNNGTSAPFDGVAGIAVGEEIDDYHTTCVTSADINGDGFLDVIVGFEEGYIALYPNNGGKYPFRDAVPTLLAGTGAVRAVVVADMDGDGDADIVAGYAGADLLYINDGSFDPFRDVGAMPVSFDTGDTHDLAAGDLDGDGDMDLVVGNYGTSRVYLNDGAADRFVGNGTDLGPETERTNTIMLVDADGDGDTDVLAGNGFGEWNRLYMNDGSSDPFANVIGEVVNMSASDTRSMAVGDIDGDGLPDLITGNYGAGDRFYINNGTRYPFSGVPGNGNVIVPDAEFSGVLNIPVTVSDGIGESDVHHASVTVTPVNDPPRIAGQIPLAAGSETPLTISLDHIRVIDPDNAYPDGFTLTVYNGDNYARSGRTVIPEAGFEGTLNVPVSVNDGENESEVRNLIISVAGETDGILQTDDSKVSEDETGTADPAEYQTADNSNEPDQPETDSIDEGGGDCFVSTLIAN